jgi:imidazolonepropionase-like amidohydrolase
MRRITRRVNADLDRRGFIAGATSSLAMLGLAAYSGARAQPAAPAVLFTNVRLFDGLALNTRTGISVLVTGGMIADVSANALTAPEGARVIDGGGRTLMPGLIDAHWHSMMAATPMPVLIAADVGDVHFDAARQATRTLMRGFTTVRDAAGPAFALKRAIDGGAVVGPRIYPSGALISQTSGHGDFRFIWELPGTPDNLTHADMMGVGRIADGRDAVLRAAREQLMKGASQVKIAAGGGASSAFDPLDSTQFLPEEIEAAVLAAADWGTYVMAHVYTPTGIKRCIKAGVRSIEHGQLADEDAVKMMADAGVVWSLQPFVEANADPVTTPERRAKQMIVWSGTDNAYTLAQKHGIPIGWGTDILFDPQATERQGRMLAYMARWFTPAKALRTATSENAFILGLSGARNPYPGGLGVIQKGAHADMLLVDGDPTEDLSLVADPDRNFRIIMKAGTIHKDTL